MAGDRIILKTVTSFKGPEVKQQAADMIDGLVSTTLPPPLKAACRAVRQGSSLVGRCPCSRALHGRHAMRPWLAGMHKARVQVPTVRPTRSAGGGPGCFGWLQVLDYQKLDSYLEMARLGSPDALPKAREQLQATLVAARDIEAFVTDVLGV
jgi:hypothetical protein